MTKLQATSTSTATGGFYLWEASAELRIPIAGDLGTAIFLDASDVNRQAMHLCAPHLSTGLGLRYNTPVGPFRADIGYRIKNAQVFGTCGGEIDYDQLVPEQNPLGTLLRLPIAVSVALGQAF